jgi:hypothetical protein
MFIWNPREHSDQQNLQWSWLRAVEWGHWPLFLSLPIAPLVLPTHGLLAVAAVLIILDIAWSALRYHWISAEWANIGALFATLRWVSGPGAAIWLLIRHQWFLAVLALFWPFFVPLLGAISRAQVGRIQLEFMRQLGYEPMSDNPLFADQLRRAASIEPDRVSSHVLRGARDSAVISLVVLIAAWGLGVSAEHSLEAGRRTAAAASLTLYIVAQSALLGMLAYWIARQPRRLWRLLGGLLVLFLILNSILSLLNLALIGDALPGGMPTPPGDDPQHIKAVAEYGLGLTALLYGWFAGARKRLRPLSTVTQPAM